MPRSLLCSRCGEPRDGAHQTYCKACHAAYTKEWYRSNPSARERQNAWMRANREKMNVYKRRWNLKKLGLVDEIEDVLERQGHECPICHDPLKLEQYNFAVDHDHETGTARDILCQRCNFLLGNARDSQYILSQAISYLRKHSIRKVS